LNSLVLGTCNGRITHAMMARSGSGTLAALHRATQCQTHTPDPEAQSPHLRKLWCCARGSENYRAKRVSITGLRFALQPMAARVRGCLYYYRSRVLDNGLGVFVRVSQPWGGWHHAVSAKRHERGVLEGSVYPRTPFRWLTCRPYWCSCAAGWDAGGKRAQDRQTSNGRLVPF